MIDLSNEGYVVISIHTPTKGATNSSAGYAWRCSISIHTPTKGATSGFVFLWRHCKHFNPHSHEGSDPGDIDEKLKANNISIHTPTKGATKNVPTSLTTKEFQSTLPRRERLQEKP